MLDDAVTYVAQDSRPAAERLLIRALDAASSLDAFSERGRVVPEFNEASGAAAAVPPRFLVCDMRDFASADVFDAAFCYFGGFGYFTEEDDLRFVRAVAGALRPGGRFLIEGHIAETLLPIYRERDWLWAGSQDNRVRVLEERSWNIETGRVEAIWTTIDDSGVRSAATSIRISTYRELRGVLESAGFTKVEVRDGKTGQAFRLGSPRALLLAEMPAR